ncbi:hypothetical protein QZH41_010034, partial [Actinostola sp. cb2023]
NATQKCKSSQHECDTGKCIHKRWVCDGESDCTDGSDERGCGKYGKRTCPPNKFTCANGKCIPRGWVCDQDDDCGDRSDENHCVDPGNANRKCKSSQHECDDGQCIHKRWVCDGDSDCSDGSDEKRCRKYGIVLVRACPFLALLQGLDDVEVGLLIGLNCARAIKPREVIPGADDDPYAKKTALGWGVIGIVDSSVTEDDDSHCSCYQIMSREVLTDSPKRLCHFAFNTQVKEVMCPMQVTQMFELDFNEVNDNQQSLSHDDRRFIQKVKEGIHKRQDGHYEIPLPLKENTINLPNNMQLALSRLVRLKGRLKSNERYRSHYQAFMNETIGKGYAERVPTAELSLDDGQVWYIPHQGVYHPKKPDKIRVVFDASAEFKGESLNRHLLQGPDLTNNLAGVLCRFRKEPIALMCDIEGMFHQIQDAIGNNDADVHINGIRSGSIIVNYTVTLKVTPGVDPVKQLTKIIKSGKLGNFSVDKTSIVFVGKFPGVTLGEYKLNTTSYLAHCCKGTIGLFEMVRLCTVSGEATCYGIKVTYEVDCGSAEGPPICSKAGTLTNMSVAIMILGYIFSKIYMFWSDWGYDSPKIERCGMNGDPNTRLAVITTNIQWPNGLTVDYTIDKIMWADAKVHTIESANLDGSHRRVILSENTMYPFAITVFNNKMYWTDMEKGGVYVADKFTGKDINVIRDGLYSPMDIHIYHQQNQPKKGLLQFSYLC